MKEKVLHYIWAKQLLPISAFFTIEGEKIEVMSIGTHNQHEGPDFLNAKIKINQTIWVGHVEIHLNSSDWIKHQHDQNKLYNNVILHVVYKHDIELKHVSLPTLEIKNELPLSIIQQYEHWMNSKSPIPCAEQFSKVSSLHKNAWWSRCIANRWERKTQEWIFKNSHSKDFMEILIRQIAINFGFKYNAQAFEELIHSIPIKILLKHQSQLIQIEALLFGQSNLLPPHSDHPYVCKLQKEYHFLRRKYGLVAPKNLQWKFMRLRPANFPTVRLAQLAMFFHYYLNELSNIINYHSWKQYQALLPIYASGFWNEYYHFKKKSTQKQKKQLGHNALQNIIINTFAPAHYLFQKEFQYTPNHQIPLQLLESLPQEQNHITKHWNKAGQINGNAFDSQAQIECYNEYCLPKRCLECGIGHQILKSLQ